MPRTRVNERIRVREVRVVGVDGRQVGVLDTRDAVALAKKTGINERGKAYDLVEISPKARPPVCKICDYGKYKYDESKKKKENKKTAHPHKTKEVQLRPRCEQHDFDTKVAHAIDFLCHEMKVKVYLRFRGRENAHKEFGFDAVNRFLEELQPYGKADTDPRLVGRGISVLVQPLPKRQRAENPYAKHRDELPPLKEESDEDDHDEAEDSGELNTAFESLEVPGEKKSA